MQWRFVQRVLASIRSPDAIWSAVDVWKRRPGVLNRRVVDAIALVEETDVVFDSAAHLRDAQCADLHLLFAECDQGHRLDVSLRKIISRQPHKHANCNDLITSCHHCALVTVLPVLLDPHAAPSSMAFPPYRFKMSVADAADGMFTATMDLFTGVREGEPFPPSVEWLATTLLPKLGTWATTVQTPLETRNEKLVDKERYADKYQELKAKYGREIIKIWPECTDPQKFVYEDVAIATYLLVLWESERAATGCGRQSFVDLGCGNGLLVYILAQEGHAGAGVDVRRRKIWSMYKEGTQLVEATLDPRAGVLPEGNWDWLIGNHSDELTPWLPYMAAEHSPTCRYFVLPCCLFDFYGKYISSDAGHGHYRYVAHIGAQCGFEVESDAMRIPSTRRICQVGMRRTYAPEDEPAAHERRRKLVASRGEGFVPRPQRPPTSHAPIDARQRHEVVVKAMAALLASPHPPLRSRGAQGVFSPAPKPWNQGGSLPLSEIFNVVDESVAQLLRSASGGVKTVLRNHWQTFVGG